MTSSKVSPKIKLNNGEEMPMFGLGTWRSYSNDAENAVKSAIDIGYRLIDTAFVYENEIEIGRAIGSKINDGVVKRSDLYIISKLAGIHHEPNLVEHACRQSLQHLNLEYLDLYLIHFPVGMEYINDERLHNSPSNTDYLDTWKAMENLVKIGLCRSIGLSNFNSEQIDRIMKNCTVKPVTNQVECHPGFNQNKLIEHCKKYNIIITAYCPLGRPKAELNHPDFLFNDKIRNLARKYSKTNAQIILRYLIQINVVPIPKTVREERLKENFDIFDFELDSDEMEILDSFDKKQRMIPFSGFEQHKYYPFNIEF